MLSQLTARDSDAHAQQCAISLTPQQLSPHIAILVLLCSRQRKLCLVLDLDHTLINSARFTEVEPEHEAQLRSHLANDALRLPEEERQLFRLERIQMWTKLRPAVRHFLETAHQHFELWIHTNGNRCCGLSPLLNLLLRGSAREVSCHHRASLVEFCLVFPCCFLKSQTQTAL